LLGGNELELSNQITCPAYFLPAQNDHANVKEKGEIIENLVSRFGAEKTGTI
jgi:hypothetical protein